MPRISGSGPVVGIKDAPRRRLDKRLVQNAASAIDDPLGSQFGDESDGLWRVDRLDGGVADVVAARPRL